MRTLIFVLSLASFAYAQTPTVEPGVSQELAKWRAAHYSDVLYKLNLTLEKMSPVLKGTMEIRVRVSSPHVSKGSTPEPGAAPITQSTPPYEGGVAAALGGRGGSLLVLDWRKIKGHEEKSTVSNVSINGQVATRENHPVGEAPTPLLRKEGCRNASLTYIEHNEHLIFRDGVTLGENVIKLDFTSPILTSGSAITRYVDKEDGSEYIYSLFVPSDASTAFPVFDQPDLKARFTLTVKAPEEWRVVSNAVAGDRWGELQNLVEIAAATELEICGERGNCPQGYKRRQFYATDFFFETKPISTYVFAFAAGPWERVSSPHVSKGSTSSVGRVEPSLTVGLPTQSSIYVRKSQAAKFKPHAAEVFRLNREAVRYFEQYFDYTFPFPKYDLVLIPEFPFGGMEHAGATFLRESSIIFPQEPTKNDYISRATLIFHEAAHQWFGDTVTMRWFDDLWLKEGFATFTAYKALEKIMPEMNAWKVFYERIKQGAYQTDSTKGTTPIYQEIKNLSAAKSAYGAIVYNKAPAFLRQAEFYLGEDKFQTAVRAFLKKHKFGNATWEDLVGEFERASDKDLSRWSKVWVTRRSLPGIGSRFDRYMRIGYDIGKDGPERFAGLINFGQAAIVDREDVTIWEMRLRLLSVFESGKRETHDVLLRSQNQMMVGTSYVYSFPTNEPEPVFVFPNYQDYGYGIFLLDEKSRDYVLKNIQDEKDPFLRSMMWGALWDSVREGELDPQAYVELVLKVQSAGKDASERDKSRTLNEDDESTVALLLNRVGTAMNYYLSDAERVSSPHVSKGSSPAHEPSLTVGLRTRVENMLIERMRNAETLGQRITFYRAFLNVAASENARRVLKEMLTAETQRHGAQKGGNPSGSEGASQRPSTSTGTLPTGRVSASDAENAPVNIPLKTKDRFDIVTRLLILNDGDAPRLLAELEKTETGDDAKRYAYAARAGIATAENKAKYWNDFVNNKEISESWIEAAFGPFNSIRHSELTLPYLQKALQELPNHKRNRKIFFVNGWLGAFIGGQRSEEALNIVNKFLADNPNLDKDLRLKILENVDLIERAVRIRAKYKNF